jgi:hypothetical protein
MGVRTQAPSGHEHVPWGSAWMHRLYPGEIVGEEGRDDELQEEPGAGMKEPQQPRHGNAAPRLLHRRLAERLLEGRRIGHGAPRAVDEKGAMPVPPPLI